MMLLKCQIFDAFIISFGLLLSSGNSKVIGKGRYDDSSLVGEPLNGDDFRRAEALQDFRLIFGDSIIAFCTSTKRKLIQIVHYEPELVSEDADVAFPVPDPTTQLEYFEGDIIEDFRSRNAVREEEYLWSDGIVPYTISKNYDERGRSLIAKAVGEFHNKTCIRFVPRKSETDYIFFNPEGGCASFVGRIGGAQGVSLSKGCYLTGVFLHELMHALGFMHEQSRHDRDEYITIKWDNIKSGRDINFQKHSWEEIQSLGEKYDYGSILHYDQYAFAKNPNKPTILTKKKGARIGQRLGFSQIDLRKLNMLYKCGQPKKDKQNDRPCSDNVDICSVLVKNGMCSRDRQRMVTRCKKSCGFCE